jgi:hypothetical protein
MGSRAEGGRGVDCAPLSVSSDGWPLVDNPEEAEGGRSGARIWRTSQALPGSVHGVVVHTAVKKTTTEAAEQMA